MRYFVHILLIIAMASVARTQPPQKAAIDRPLPKGAVLRLGTPHISLPGDAGPIALSPDGKQIAFGSAIVNIHDVATGIPRYSVKMPESTIHFASMAQLVWSRDGKVLVGVDNYGQCMAVDTATKKLLWPARKAGVFPPYPAAVTSLRFTQENHLAAAICPSNLGQEGTDEFAMGKGPKANKWRVQLWDLNQEGATVWEVDAEKQGRLAALGKGYAFSHVALSPTGAQMAYLSGSKVGDKSMKDIARLSTLRVLGLSNTVVTDKGLVALTALKELKELKVAKAAISNAGLKHLAGMTSLEYLSLEHSVVTDAGLQQLASLKILRRLYLYESRVTSTGLAQLRKALPGCKITTEPEVVF